MGSKTFQVRHCLNPACGLRYPWYEGQDPGDRCPHCLGTTEIVVKAVLPGEGPLAITDRHATDRAVLLDNIRSAWNVGSILRTAEGFGFSHAYLCGITPGPDNHRVLKTALGAQDSLAWSMHKDAAVLVRQLKADGKYILALETGGFATPLLKFTSDSAAGRPIVLIVGNEVTGVDPELLEEADQVVDIRMHGGKSSFNVAVAFGMAGFFLTSRP